MLLCIDKDNQYRKLSDKIVHVCTEKAKTPLKTQKLVIDRIKEVIKAEPEKYRAQSKFFALKLLNKIVLKKNTALNNYVEAKIMGRLTTLAEFNNDPDEKSAQALLTRGRTIFGPNEPDTQSSANFLIILLDCIEKWALTFMDDGEPFNDNLSSLSRGSTVGERFHRSY